MADETTLANAVKETRTPESSLLDHVERIAHARAGRFAVYLHLSRLQPHNRLPHHIRIASRTFDSLLRAADARLYILSNGDLALMCRDVRVDDVDYVIGKVRTLFKTDPLASPTRAEGPKGFTTWYDLEADYEDFLSLVSRLARHAEAEIEAREDASAGQGQGLGFAGQALDPMSLAKVDDSLRRIRIADLIRVQPAVIIGADGGERILFEENFVSIGELQRRVAPGFNLVSNVWLFQHLTEHIDRRILPALARQNLGDREFSTSINLNISTVMAHEFNAFDSEVNDYSEKIIIELQQLDIFADITAYFEARDWLRDRGYRVLVDGLNPLSLRYFDPALLQADFVKVGWGSEFTGFSSIEDQADLADLIEHVGRDKFVIARTDSEDALKWALELGIRRFQGFFIDQLVARQLEKDGRLAGPSKGS